MLLLVAGRWLVGWVFPAKDLEILDDPIPEKLYCGRHCTPDRIDCTGCCSKNGSDNSSDVERGLTMTDDIDGKYEEKKQVDINITREMNNCDLWKHMVGTMDREPSSSNGGGRTNAKSNLISKFEEAQMNEVATSVPSNVELTGHANTSFKSTEV